MRPSAPPRRARTAGRRRHSPRRRWLLAGGAGAAFASLAVGLLRPPLGLWPSYAEMQADYRTATGEQRRYALDAQQLTLALNTQTSLNVATRDGRPEIELVAGEAIQARRDQPCLVKAGAARLLLADGDIEIRRLRGQQVQLRCNAGQLEVRHPQGALRLAAGMQIAYDDDALDAPAPLPARPSDWRAGVVSFHDLPLEQAIDEINRYRPGRVVLMNGDLARRRLSARYEVQDLDQAIAQIQQLYGARVRRVGDLVFLS